MAISSPRERMTLPVVAVTRSCRRRQPCSPGDAARRAAGPSGRWPSATCRSRTRRSARRAPRPHREIEVPHEGRGPSWMLSPLTSSSVLIPGHRLLTPCRPPSFGSNRSRKPSPSRLNPITATAIATPGQTTSGEGAQELLGLLEHASPRGDRRRGAESEEGQRGFGQHGQREGHGALDDQHSRDVGQHVASGDAERPLRGGAGRQDVFGVHHLQRSLRATRANPGTEASPMAAMALTVEAP